MATFLELCRKVARESGTIPGDQPVAVTGQTGRLEKVVYWTAQAWLDIQNARQHWFWMVHEFERVTLPGVARYTGASWSLPRLASWLAYPQQTTIYRQSEGKSRDAPLAYADFPSWRLTFDRGTHDQNTPTVFAISPAGELCLGATPDDAYVVRGVFRATPQRLVGASDVPEMPERFHDLIAWRGLRYLAEHDEAQMALAIAVAREGDLMRDLMRDQLPPFNMTGAGPLA
jgi:hypothetical protein